MKLFVRADASSQVGAGHLMRCFALAQRWKAHAGEVTFITFCESEGLRRRLTDEGFQVISLKRTYPDALDWQTTSQVLATHPGAWVVLDGYHFDPMYQGQIREAGHPLLLIDDTAHLEHYNADIILNQNQHAERLFYSCEPNTRLLLGTNYTLLRSEFLIWQKWQRQIPQIARKILVTLGGADSKNVTSKVIQALAHVERKNFEAIVVVGASNPRYEELRSAIQNLQLPIELKRNVSNMAELMAWADVAVSAGGSTAWEMAFMGLPNLIVTLAENQEGIAQALHSLGVANHLGWYTQINELELANSLQDLMSNPVRRQTMSELGRQIIDGAGMDRVVSTMKTHSTSLTGQLQVRPAHLQDAEMLWRWANNPAVRANSFHPEPIPLDTHLQWYKRKLASSKTRIWILELDQEAVGQIRYDKIDQDRAEIDFSVVANCRGKGIGTRALVLTSTLVAQELGIRYLQGTVFSSNKSSRRAFIKAGFRCVDQRVVSGKPSHIFHLEISSDSNGICGSKYRCSDNLLKSNLALQVFA